MLVFLSTTIININALCEIDGCCKVHVCVIYPGRHGPHSASLSGVPAVRTVAL